MIKSKKSEKLNTNIDIINDDINKLLTEISKKYKNLEKSLLSSEKRVLNKNIITSLKELEISKKEYFKNLKKYENIIKNSENNYINKINLQALQDTLYPSIYNEKFNSELFENKILQNYYDDDTKNIIKKLYNIYNVNKSIDNDIEDENKYSFFKLSNAQKILRNFMSFNTNYRNLLLIHGTGVGKTCTAITIAENLKKQIQKFNKKIFIIRADEFKRQIFDKNKLYTGDINNQCTRDSYIEEIIINKYREELVINCKLGSKYDCTKLEKIIKKQIAKYYDFYTPFTWAKMVEKLIDSKTNKLIGLQKKKKTIEVIRNLFNDTLLIIDEAHNLRDSSTNSSDKDNKKENGKSTTEDIKNKKDKVVPPVLNKVLLYSQNLRLLLLSATPMYDKPSNILTLLNYMLLNDNRPILTENEIFNKDYNIKSKLAEQKIINASRGYISYIRGNDPINFPLRLSAKYNIPTKMLDLKKYPNNDITNKKLKTKINYLELINCPFSSEHQKLILKFINKNIKEKSIKEKSLKEITFKELSFKENNNKNDIKDNKSTSNNILIEKSSILDDIDDSILDENNYFSVAYISELQISNFMYQTLKESGNNPPLCYGISGFNSVTTKMSKQLTYKFINEDYGKRFLPENLKKYSSKIAECLENVKKSNGPVFIYSYYTSGGVMPMAFALEMAGYKRYNNEPELLQNKYKSNKSMGEYIIYTGNEQLSRSAESYFNKRENMIKDKNVKVVLASKKGSEGLNLWGFREIHILDPWHNINLLEQVIGRVIRNKSHHHLDSKNRNISLYMYASTMSGNEKNKESIDLRVYNICEQKVIQSGKVELLLKQNAIDCQIHKNINYKPKELYKEKVELNTSHNKKIKYNLSDKPYSKETLYMKDSNYKCLNINKDIKEKKNKIDKNLKNKNITNTNNNNKELSIIQDIDLSLYEIEIKELIGLVIQNLKNNLNLTVFDIYNILNNEYPTLNKKNVSYNIINYIFEYLEFYDKTIIDNYENKCNIIVSYLDNVKLIRLLPEKNLNPNLELFYQNVDTIDKLKGKILNFTKKNKKLYFEDTIYKGFKKIDSIKINDYVKKLLKNNQKIVKEEVMSYNLILNKIHTSLNNIIYSIKQNQKKSTKTGKINKNVKQPKSPKSHKSLKSTKSLINNLNNNTDLQLDDIGTSLFIDKNKDIIKFYTNFEVSEFDKYNEIVAVIYDRLYINEKVFLLQNIVHRLITEQQLSTIEKKILKAIKFNIVYNYEIFKVDKTNKDIFGFIIASFNKLVLYKYIPKKSKHKTKLTSISKKKSKKVSRLNKNNKLSKKIKKSIKEEEPLSVSEREETINLKNINNYFIIDKTNISKIIQRRWDEIQKKEINRLFGYLVYNKSTLLPPIFKITDYLTKGLKKSVKGITCSSKPINEILNYIKLIEKDYKKQIKTQVKHKKIVCNDLELLFRIGNNTENKIYFFNPEEYYIWLTKHN